MANNNMMDDVVKALIGRTYADNRFVYCIAGRSAQPGHFEVEVVEKASREYYQDTKLVQIAVHDRRATIEEEVLFNLIKKQKQPAPKQ